MYFERLYSTVLNRSGKVDWFGALALFPCAAATALAAALALALGAESDSAFFKNQTPHLIKINVLHRSRQGTGRFENYTRKI